MNINFSLEQQYFDDVYRQKADPWDFETSDYEKAKYEATVNALTEEAYNQAFEIGCSIGVLTGMLAPKCHKLLAVDVSDLPLASAKKRLQNDPWVTIKKMAVPREFPAENFDLVILSEVGYYWSRNDLEKAKTLIIDHLEPKGQLILVHWTNFVPDYPLTGTEVHEAFIDSSGYKKQLNHLLGKREEKYRLDLFEKNA